MITRTARLCPPCEVDATGRDSTWIPRGRAFVCPVCGVEFTGPAYWRQAWIVAAAVAAAVALTRRRGGAT